MRGPWDISQNWPNTSFAVDLVKQSLSRELVLAAAKGPLQILGSCVKSLGES